MKLVEGVDQEKLFCLDVIEIKILPRVKIRAHF